ncbi:MAG: metallophosphoesterase N-terminal domain-containing protein, partial [Pseudomonadota bacterium]
MPRHPGLISAMSRNWLALSAAVTLAACATVPVDEDRSSRGTPSGFADYVAGPEIIRGTRDGADTVRGTVFEDVNQNGRRDASEPGLAGVKVSNGRDVVETSADGDYALPARSDMSVFVIQPSGFQVPHDENWVPQIAYEHKPAGSPKPLRYGGLPSTGALPEAINFPLIA